MKRLACLPLLLAGLIVLVAEPPEADAGGRTAWFHGGYYPASYGYSAGYYSAGYYPIYDPPYCPTATVNILTYYPQVIEQGVIAVFQPPVAAPPYIPNPAAAVAQARPAPQQAPAQAPAYDCKAHSAAQDAKIAELTALVRAIVPPQQAKPPAVEPAPQPQAAPVAGLTVLTTRCVGCHDEKEAKVAGTDGKLKGGGHIYFREGKLLPLTDRQLRAMGKQINSGKMPPDKPLDNKEGPVVLEYLDTLPGKDGDK